MACDANLALLALPLPALSPPPPSDCWIKAAMMVDSWTGGGGEQQTNFEHKRHQV